jgi:hypothetical protein
MQATLEAAVDGVYAAFAGYRRPTDIDYCGHCVRPGVVEGLLAPTPLREIPAERLHGYTSDVLSTAGSLADFRYFLPRILHLAVTGGFDDYHGRNMILGKFVLGGWRDWPEGEQQAVTAFLHAWWRTTLMRFPADPDPDELLDSINDVEDDLGPYLRMWEDALATHAGASHLREFVLHNFERKGRRYWMSGLRWRTDTTVLTWLGGLSSTVAATAETVTNEETYDVLLELLTLL